jgi:hypothetical protein
VTFYDWMKLAVYWTVGGTFVTWLIAMIFRYCDRPAPENPDHASVEPTSLHDRVRQAHDEHVARYGGTTRDGAA